MIWQCKVDESLHEDGRRRFFNNQCRELTLPSSDLAYKAELVVVYTAPENQVSFFMNLNAQNAALRLMLKFKFFYRFHLALQYHQKELLGIGQVLLMKALL